MIRSRIVSRLYLCSLIIIISLNLTSCTTTTKKRNKNKTIRCTREEQHGAKININIATIKELMLLKDVNPGLARKIIACRKKNGPFKNQQDLLKVNGMSKSFWKHNKNQIIFEDEEVQNKEEDIEIEDKIEAHPEKDFEEVPWDGDLIYSDQGA